MKNFRILYKQALIALLSVSIVACDDDGEESFTDFASIASHYNEIEAGTITIPLRNPGNVSGLDIELGGTAVEGEDYSVEGITTEGVQIAIIDDDDMEENETIRVRLLSGGSAQGNAVHVVTIINNCEDKDGLSIDTFTGEYETSYTIGSDTYAGYHEELEADEADPTIVWTHTFFAEEIDAYIKVDLAAGTAYFPDQDAGGYIITNSTGTFDLCSGQMHMVIDLEIDGDPWTFEYLLP